MLKRIETLLPLLTELREELLDRAPAGPSETSAPQIFKFEMLPYCLRVAREALFQLASEEHAVVKSAAFATPLQQGMVGSLDHEDRDRLNLHVDHFFDAVRRAQDALIPYISAAIPKHLPRSMDAMVKDLKSGKLLLPTVGELVKRYWETHGKRAKDYRDLSQHFALVASDARVSLSSAGVPKIYLALPNNPEEKGHKNLRFGSPTVHALPYVREQFRELLTLTYRVARVLRTPAKVRPVYRLTFREPLRMGPGIVPEGHPLVTDDELEAEIDDLLRELVASGT